MLAAFRHPDPACTGLPHAGCLTILPALCVSISSAGGNGTNIKVYFIIFFTRNETMKCESAVALFCLISNVQ
jgi:hypothetical protein